MAVSNPLNTNYMSIIFSNKSCYLRTMLFITKDFIINISCLSIVLIKTITN